MPKVIVFEDAWRVVSMHDTILTIRYKQGGQTFVSFPHDEESGLDTKKHCVQIIVTNGEVQPRGAKNFIIQ